MYEDDDCTMKTTLFSIVIITNNKMAIVQDCHVRPLCCFLSIASGVGQVGLQISIDDDPEALSVNGGAAAAARGAFSIRAA